MDQSGGECPGGQNDQSRECIASDSGAPDAIDPKHDRLNGHGRGSPRAPTGFGMGRSVECIGSDAGDRNLALTAGEIDEFSCSSSNHEREYFNSLVTMMENEIAQSEKRVTTLASKVNLIEVFCSDQSMLTEQVNHLGGKAIDSGLSKAICNSLRVGEKLFDCSLST